jgi:hypothetical protein
MIVFFTKENSTFNEGQVVPLVELPLGKEGKKIELNDFQWWAPTDKWEGWLKAHPREWKAENEHPAFNKSTEEIFESLVKSGSIDPHVVSFEEFSFLMEDEKSEKSEEGGEISDEEASKRFTKFVFAYNKLLEEKKINLSISFDKLQVNSEYALIMDLVGEGGQDIEQSRNAYKFKPINSSAKFVIGEINETLLTGPIPEGSSMADTLIKTGKIVTRVALIGGLTIAGVAFGWKAVTSLAGRLRWAKALGTVIPGMKTAGTIGRSSWFFVKTLGGAVPFLKGTVTAIRGGRNLAQAIEFGSLAANSARLAAGAAKGSNPVGWIITAAMTGQQLYNWFSDKQAPRYGEIEDENVGAQDSFSPGSIADGSAITVCWTQEAGQGGILSAIQNALITNDTRTTMNLLKIGNFNNKALFFLVNIHSEMYDKMLKENPSIFIAFNQNAKFEHGFFDNDDIEMEMIIPEGGKDAGAAAFFHGYCAWSEISEAFKSADDKMLEVPENAPEEYSFHFKYGEKSRDVNVTGSLVSDLEKLDTVKATFGLSEEKSSEESKNESYNSSKVFSFSEFQKVELNEGYRIFEEDEKPKDSKDSESSAETPEGMEKVNITGTQKVAAYEVKEIKFADASFEGETLPDLGSFIIPNDYLEAENNESIKVEPIQDLDIKSPRKGTITIENETAEDPVLAPTGGTGSDEESETGGVTVEVTKDEIKSIHRDNPEFLNSIGLPDVDKIKDKDKDDKIKLLDFVTPEEKEQLGIEEWEYIKKLKIYKGGKTGDPYMIKFKSGGANSDRKRKIKSSDPAFETALKVAERIKAGFKQVDSDKDEEVD